MAEKRRVYTDECKQDAVRLVTEQGYGTTEAARNLGITANMLRRWRHQFATQAHVAAGVHGRLSPEREALECLRGENKRLRMEREILKKTVTFFANESR